MILIVLHIITCIVIAILLKKEFCSMRWSIYPVVLFVPIVGVAIFGVELWNVRYGVKKKEIGLDSFKIDEIRYKRIEVDSRENENLLVPLEEAMVINSNEVQRMLLMEILQNNPNNEVALLQKASMSSDTELTHYATTTMMSIQTDYEQQIRELNEQLNKTPDHTLVLRKMRSIIKKYIASGLITGNILKIYQNKLLEVVNRLLLEKPANIALLIDKATLLLDMGNYDDAKTIIEKLGHLKPEDEQVVMLQINYYRMMNDGKRVRTIAEKILHSREYHSWKFLNQMEFFVKG